ncbi:serine/threonine-protein kinase [Chitinivorax tropicus]|uniref:non-specific serine/threonine protein kinase n=1 Tax=Chitinivorax tropicus TaxID=714531 RepID=A0A840MQN8_9PROT|nr:serine/threonine-protein kinase [Chitinivorax tropicus]MBB5018766.1 serine/threonine-protein kinase [Chitinivorax tropicus]
MSSNLPTNLGKYQVTGLLGKGAMGVVYKAQDPHIKRTVAIKTVRRELLDADQEAQLVMRFKNEAQAAGGLSHPGIVAVYEYGEEEELAFIVMEYIAGSALDAYFKQGVRFPLVDVVSIMAQLLDALGYAHGQGVVHRDIKPANIMIMTNGKLKIADFGIARVGDSELTQVGMVMGTPSYIAPEQYMGKGRVDQRADLFSVAVVFYQLLTGEKPFTGASDAVIYKVCHEQPALPSAVAPDRHIGHFDAAIMKALAKQPEERFQTAKEFYDAILQAHRAPAMVALSEETIIHRPAPVAPPSTDNSSTSMPPSHWDANLLKEVEGRLARIMGPFAKIMVRKAAKLTNNIDELYQRLAQEIEQATDRTEFLNTRTTLTQITGTSLSGSHIAREVISQDAIDRAARLLAPYIGPIAKILAKKQASKSDGLQDYHRQLAENITNPQERERFMKEIATPTGK